jgi:arylsulfatase A-like enzyme
VGKRVALRESTGPQPGPRPLPGEPSRVSAKALLLLAISCGLAGGYLDVTIIFLKKLTADPPKNYENAADFPWSVPVGHVVLLLIPGMFLTIFGWLRSRPVSLRSAAWLFSTLAFWAALLRMPFYGAASLVLAVGVGRPASASIVVLCRRPRKAGYVALGLVGLLLILAVLTSGRRALREYRALSGLPPPPANARNVVMIIWDTVRGADVSLYGYRRNTTPNLVRWAQRGVRYNLPLAPGNWTYPSHSSFFTGYWPFQLISSWKYSLDAPVPTLAEYLAGRGFLTAGFSANTPNCCYETRLDRGFVHFEDYPFAPRSLLSRTVPGSWILENILYHDNFYEAKWIRVQSRNASAINRSFLDWLEHRPRDRPFFAYLNYFDAHEPYMAPAGYGGRFGVTPRTARDYRFLLGYGTPGRKTIPARDLRMARDSYDDCIAYMDDCLGQLLDDLQGGGVLDNTVVIIASDHGESFGQHGYFLHGMSLYLDEIGVPLVILAPDAPAGRSVDEPVSLRDLPATIVDRLGLSAGSPFPGRTLAKHWFSPPGGALGEVTPSISEMAGAGAFRQTGAETGLERRDVQMSLVAHGLHFVRDGFGAEQLFDLSRDQSEKVNLINTAEGQRAARELRKLLLDELNASPSPTEVENAYLKAYKQWLQSVVEKSPAPSQARLSLW